MTDTKKSQDLSHEDIEVAVQNYLKHGGKIQRVEIERASTDLNLVLERGWQDYSITDTKMFPIFKFSFNSRIRMVRNNS